MEASLLVELLTEELPPKSLKTLGTVFGEEVLKGLERRKLRASGESALRIFATPRRLGALITGVLDKAADREQEVSGPSVKAGRDAAGKPTAALLGFARKIGIAVEALEERDSPKGRVFVARLQVSGVALDAAIGEILTEAIRKLPIPKVMRWGDRDAEFVRPVHGLVILHGKRVVPGSVLG
ncbi:MAG TPA: glycine--tRNA ligase subunit beta, partial [Burkholderiales bacterium]|nr:glycine--tRNA ligase subunit beta [Burkholderiales bacterium]